MHFLENIIFKIFEKQAHQGFLHLKLRPLSNWIKIEWINVKTFKDFGLSYLSG